MHQKGFTLIEILIALGIFALLAVMTASALRQSYLNQTAVAKQAKALHDIQLTFSRLTQDITQITNRPIRADNAHLFPAFIGQPTYIEFTKGGENIFSENSKQSYLVRVAYLCRDNKLTKRSFHQLDPLSREHFDDEVILEHLTTCRFSFFNSALQSFPLWRGALLVNDQASVEPLPKAIQVNLTLADFGESNSLFLIPSTIYVNKKDLPSSR